MLMHQSEVVVQQLKFYKNLHSDFLQTQEAWTFWFANENKVGMEDLIPV